jgi:hypothetical protein
MYGALGVFSIFVLIIMIPLTYSLKNKISGITPPKKSVSTIPNHNNSISTQKQNISGSFTIPPKTTPPPPGMTSTTEAPRQNREHPTIKQSQTPPKDTRKNWNDQWR